MHTIAVKAYTQLTKDLNAEEPKARGPEKSTTQHSNNFEYLGRAWKEKKKDRHNRDREQKADGSNPVSKVNIVDTSNHANKNRNADWPKKNSNQVICCNYDQKRYYISKYL